MHRRRLSALVFAGVLATTLACSESDGRSLPPADPARTTTTPSAPVIQPPTGAIDVFTVHSAAFADGGTIPERFTCRSDAPVSPDLSWTGTPLDTATLAIVARDGEAGGFVHWIVTGIAPFVQGIGEGGIPENAVEGPNSGGSVGWLGPCPPAGSGMHTYEIAVLALTSLVTIPRDSTGEEAAALIEASASAHAVLTGTVTFS